MGCVKLPLGSYVEFLTVEEIENLDQTKRHVRYKEMLKELKAHPEIYKGSFRVSMYDSKGYRDVYSLARNVKLKVPLWCLKRIWMPDYDQWWADLFCDVENA